jgi:hypothetical protein
VPDKAPRVHQFHAATLEALNELVAAAGLSHPSELRAEHFSRRVSSSQVKSFAELYPALAPGALLRGTDDARFAEAWALADPHSFAPRRA